MYTLYYLTRNDQLNIMHVDSLDVCIPIHEDLIFIACRDGINFVKEPPTTLGFSDIERLIMSTEFFDTKYIKSEDYRKANTQMCPVEAPIFEITDFYIDGSYLCFPVETIGFGDLYQFEFSQHLTLNEWQVSDYPNLFYNSTVEPARYDIYLESNYVRVRLKNMTTGLYSQPITVVGG